MTYHCDCHKRAHINNIEVLQIYRQTVVCKYLRLAYS
jgi:hypothetical protein